jgi:hypothetical protein
LISSAGGRFCGMDRDAEDILRKMRRKRAQTQKKRREEKK